MTWNPGAERIKGYSSREIIGKPYATFFTEEDRRAGKPERILRSGQDGGPVPGRGLATAQGRHPLLGERGGDGAARRGRAR